MLKKQASRVIKGLLAGVLTFSGITVASVENVRAVSAVEREEDYTQYVDCFVGTQGDHGILFPGSVVPQGFVSVSPDTTHGSRVGYEYTANEIKGFSHTRVPGVGGGGAGGDVLVTPTYMNYTVRPDKKSREQKFYKENGKKVEEATPGYYRTEIVPNTGTDSTYESNTSMGNIEAEVTSDVRTGLHNYTFPKAGNASILVDLNNAYNHRMGDTTVNVVKGEDGKVSISGHFQARNVLWSGNKSTYLMNYYLEVSKPVTGVSTWENGTSALGEKMNLKGEDIGAVLNFDVKEGETIQVKTTISPISEEQAKIDMYNEMPHWDFDKVRKEAKDAWNEVLGKVRIENSATSDPDNRLKKLFYTNMYHMFMVPMNATSTDGKWRGNDRSLHEADGYTHYDCWTFWDDYRKYAIIGLTEPDFYKDIAQSTIDMLTTGYHDSGIPNQPTMTVRNEYAITVIADALNKGVSASELTNLEAAYNKAIEIADKHMGANGVEYGYVDGKFDTTVTTCFEYWGIANVAKALGKDADAKKYAQKALGYKNLFRKDAPVSQHFDGEEIGVLWPKHTPNVAGGSWLSCTPDKWSDLGMGQGSLWQYMWYDGYDLGGYIDMMGGKENALKVLSFVFGEQDPDNGKAMLHCSVNEIDPQLPFLFNYVGKPSKTQYWTRQVFSKKSWNRYSGTGEYNPPIYDYVYKLTPDGYLTTMDDDAGAMSSMYVAAAMGLLPVTPGDTNIQIGSPFFEKMTLEVGDGKTFTIEAKNVSPDNFYIQSAKLNGKDFNRSWIDYSELAQGGSLSFEMGDKASTWAEDGEDSFSLSDYVDYEIKEYPKNLKIEFENRNAWSGNGLKTEGNTDTDGNKITNVGGTTPNSWLRYNAIDFDIKETSKISVRYANNSGRCKPDARLEFYLDSMEGTPFQVVEIPPTGSDWKIYKTVTEELTTKLSGVHDVYVVLRGEEGGNPYISNLDWFEFFGDEEITDPDPTPDPEPVDKSELQKLYNDNLGLLEFGDRYEFTGFMAFEHAMYSAKCVLADEESTQADVDKAIEVLKEKIAGLKEVGPADYSKVDEAIARAEALNKDLYKDFTGVEEAIEAVVRDLDITEQTKVDAMAKAIEDAIGRLVLKDADYSKVNEAIAKVPADLSKYTEESVKALNEAVDAVVRDLDITKQTDVDAMAKAIEEALAGLVEWIEWLPIGPSEPVIPWTPLEPSKPIVPTTPLEPSTPIDKGNNGDKEEGTDTGDTSNAAGMAGLMLLAGAVIVSRRRKATK